METIRRRPAVQIPRPDSRQKPNAYAHRQNPESPTGRLHPLLRLTLQPRREPPSKSRLTQSVRLEPTSQRSSEYPDCAWWRRTERKPLRLTLVVAHNLLPRIPGWFSYLSGKPSQNPEPQIS